MKATFLRYIGFSSLGAVAFLFDLALLFYFKQEVGMYYLHAATLSFILATTFQYLAVRGTVFKKSSRSYIKGYPYFIIIALINLGITLGLMNLAVEKIGINYLIARVLVAPIVGTINFVINNKLTFNFKLMND